MVPALSVLVPERCTSPSALISIGALGIWKLLSLRCRTGRWRPPKRTPICPSTAEVAALPISRCSPITLCGGRLRSDLDRCSLAASEPMRNCMSTDLFPTLPGVEHPGWAARPDRPGCAVRWCRSFFPLGSRHRASARWAAAWIVALLPADDEGLTGGADQVDGDVGEVVDVRSRRRAGRDRANGRRGPQGDVVTIQRPKRRAKPV